MSKTFNFSISPKQGAFWLSLLLLVLGAPDAAAQQSKIIERCTAAPSPSPTTKLKKASVVASEDSPIVRTRASETEINSTIRDDPSVEKMLKPYTAKVRALDVVIGRLEGELKKGGIGAGSLGNFVADGMRAQASKQLGVPVDLAVTNGGGLRKSAIAPGELRVRDIFELLPFENKLVALEMTGEQLLNVLKAVVASREPQAGARIKYRTGSDQKPELVSVNLIGADGGETDINPAATYRIIATDYLLNVSGGNLSILQQAKSRKPLGVTIRDALIEYVKAETAAGRMVKTKLDGRFLNQDRQKTEEPPQ